LRVKSEGTAPGEDLASAGLGREVSQRGPQGKEPVGSLGTRCPESWSKTLQYCTNFNVYRGCWGCSNSYVATKVGAESKTGGPCPSFWPQSETATAVLLWFYFLMILLSF